MITGCVVGTGLADELRDQRYLLVESRDRLHYIPQPASIERARGLGQLRIGDIVTLHGETIEKGGHTMVETRVQALSRARVEAATRTGQPVVAGIRERLAPIVELAAVGMALAVVVGGAFGLAAGWRPGGLLVFSFAGMRSWGQAM